MSTIMLLFSIFCSVNIQAQNVNIPDVNFKTYLLENSTINKNNDANISVAEAASFTGEIILFKKDISNLTGIEAFTALTKLDCSSNPLLTSLDVSKNTALTSLACYENAISSLDVSTNTALTSLICYSNKLTTLDVSKNMNLTTLYCNDNNLSNLEVSNNTLLTNFLCYNNAITSLDISTNLALTRLVCYNNKLSNIEISKNTGLTTLFCNKNLLTNIDITKNIALTVLYSGDNLLTNLDVSKNTALTKILCNNNALTNLDVSKNSALTTLVCNNNPKLTCIQYATNVTPNSNWIKDAEATWSTVTCGATLWTGTTNNDWNTATNWKTNTVPITDEVIIIPAGLTNYPTVNNLVTFNSLTIQDGASFIAKADVTGTVIYKQNISDTNWYLVGSPVVGENIKNLIDTHTFASGTNGNIGIGVYSNAAGSAWNYEKTATASTNPINLGLGLSVKLANSGTLSFTGTANTSDVSIGITKGTRTNFNLIGNPFTAYISADKFTTENTNLLSEETIWVWNGTEYETYNANTSLEIVPGQAFFVSANSNGNVTFKAENQKHKRQLAARELVKPSFELFVENKASKKSTKVFYVNNKTTGFDNGYDSSMFVDTASKFDVFTELITENKGDKLAIQTLPTSKIEEIVIPVGLTAKSGKEVTFSVNTQNLPADVKIYLEDRIANSFTNISEKSHKVVLENQAKGVGQFYIHTTSKNLEIATVSENLQEDLEKVSILNSGNNSVTITGLQNENVSVNVYSMLGKKVISKQFKATGVHVIQLSKMEKGIYIVELNSDSGKITKKIIL
ncbi:T9SS type A sorting domain-containing protein [Tenacibaculum piscium]|uniref:T9SS type A sorting domain-containing protein n=1 Tax=Tenacibaculum piscium TaxID=1458515 RepID=UPI001F4791AE|nr:T9SS type A sorting domain-containing protein [Tenacibaculum piscium]